MRDIASKRDTRDERLWRLLPGEEAPYDFQTLSEAKSQALIEALTDGFGSLLVQNSEALPLPPEIKTGLLLHAHHVTVGMEYDPYEWNYAFSNSRGDEPAPSEFFPLGFIRRRLQTYFQNQFERFCVRMARELEFEDTTPEDTPFFERCALQRLYQKPWYEVHALQFLDSIESALMLERPQLDVVLISSFSGELGRLVEQYFWRFQFEQAAITGVGARKGASAGGKVRAAAHKNERAN